MISRRPLFAVSTAGLFLSCTASAQMRAGLWFDPTQLPSYTGRLERWIASPSGSVERGLLRQGTQFVFPASEAQALAASIEPGATICVWGIRARSAAIVMMLAWARTESDPANFVDRPAWFPIYAPGLERLTLSGRILAPLLSPQGEPMGVILTEASQAIRLPIAVHAALGDVLRAGSDVTAEGLGTRRGAMEAIDAERLGKDAASLQPLPVPAPASSR